MRVIRAFFIKELLQLRADKRLVAFLVVMPLVLLLLFGYALKMEPENVAMALVDNDKSIFSDTIKTSLWSEGYFQMYEVSDKAQIIADIRSGKARAGLFIASDFSAKLIENEQPTIEFFVDGTMPSLTTAMKNKAGAMTDDEVTHNMYFFDENATNVFIPSEPFIKTTTVLFNPDEKETWFFLPGVVGVLIMQVTLILGGIAVVREKEQSTLEQILVSPATKVQFMLGKMLPYVIISFIEFYVILLIGYLVFDMPIPTSAYGGIFLLSLIYVGTMIALGVLLSTISQTQQQVMFLAIFIMIPSILLSGFVFPLEAMPHLVQGVAYILPFTYFVEIIRGLLIKQTYLSDLLPYYSALFGFMLLFFIISIKRFQRYML